MLGLWSFDKAIEFQYLFDFYGFIEPNTDLESPKFQQIIRFSLIIIKFKVDPLK